MGWSNSKYYQKFVNGFLYNGTKRFSNPTINYIFGGINHAFHYYFEIYNPFKSQIIALIYKYFLFELI
ncbi:MAG: hypothetical protein HUJ42_03725 [Malacoplasma sp.]|nr:hypothetical protein [Malacoplasma sp.]